VVVFGLAGVLLTTGQVSQTSVQIQTVGGEIVGLEAAGSSGASVGLPERQSLPIGGGQQDNSLPERTFEAPLQVSTGAQLAEKTQSDVAAGSNNSGVSGPLPEVIGVSPSGERITAFSTPR
jgi:hypothetical protein